MAFQLQHEGFAMPQNRRIKRAESNRARSQNARREAVNPTPSRATSDHHVIVTWLWRSRSCRTIYTADHVNTWARMVARNVSKPHRLVCLTDDPEGIEIDTLPLPRDCAHITTDRWRPERGYPQCFRRISLWNPTIAEYLGSDRIVSMDLDIVVFDSLDPMLERSEDVVLYRGTGANRPYNGSMLMMDAGARPHVYERFTSEGAAEASRTYLGSDQAWLAHALGDGEARWTDADGARHITPPIHRSLKAGQKLPPMRSLFFTGKAKPWHFLDHPQIADHYR